MKDFRAIVLVLAVFVCRSSLHAQRVNAIEAIVHDAVVTQYEIDQYTKPSAQQLQRQYRTQPAEFEKEYERLRSENREQLVERQLILRDFNSAGYNLPESFFDQAVQEEVTRAGGRVKLTKMLQMEGITFEKFRQQIRERNIIQQMRYKNISQELIISPHKIETYYLAHQDDFKLEDQVRLRTIDLIKPSGADGQGVRQLADEIHSKIKEGAAFSEMAAVYSQGPQRNDGGERGWVERKDLRKELSDVAFTLKPSEFSGVIETPEACYLILVEEKRPAHVKPLSEVQEEIERTMLTQERSRLQKQYVDRLRKKTFFRYF